MDPSPPLQERYEQQLQRILKSVTFRNTEVLKRLLEYLGRSALAGNARGLKEYTVGIEAFSKPMDYDPKSDSSVRVQSGKLRQRLEEYYRTEGASDAVIVELPKGGFEVQFRPRAATRPEPEQSRGRQWPWIIAAIAAIWAIAATMFVMRSGVREGLRARYFDPNVVALWRPFLEGSRPVVVCLGTPLFAKISGDFFRSPVLNNPKSLDSSQEVKAIENDLKGKPIPAFPYTGIGEASAAFEVAALFTAHQRDLNLIPSSALSWEDISRNNVIFIGPPKYNLQESDLPIKQDFAIQHGRLDNLRPKAGEPGYFSEKWSPDQSQPVEGYALVSRLPGLHGTGSVMLLASTSTEGARAAIEYVTRPEYAARLVQTLGRTDPERVKYFQAVIRARFQGQTPIQIEQVAVHILE